MAAETQNPSLHRGTSPSGDPRLAESTAALEGLSSVFTSLGRALICLGPDFRVIHVSAGLEDLVAGGDRRNVVGKPATEILGERLFGSHGLLRQALAAGEMREGWGATLRLGSGGSREVSITAAPISTSPVCDPRVAYLVVLRPHQETASATPRQPTVFCGMVARAASMQRIFSLVKHLRESDATVFVTGESGTGKELVARAIHRNSPRAKGSFVAVNCGALPGELLESELFGHVRGAFTGAVRDRVGRFELAAGGTLFLDEAGDLPLHLQVKLLRVLQERTFERVGDSRSRRTDARIIAATHLDLRRAVTEGTFRDDLYYRLRVVPIEVPPLRRRREDIEPIAAHLLERINTRMGRSLRTAPEVTPKLLRYDWPGNVRELENALEFAVAVCGGQTIHPRHLPPEVGARPATEPAPFSPPVHAVAEPPVEPAGERDRLVQVLNAHHWRRDETARALGISRTTLWRKMRENALMD